MYVIDSFYCDMNKALIKLSVSRLPGERLDENPLLLVAIFLLPSFCTLHHLKFATPLALLPGCSFFNFSNVL